MKPLKASITPLFFVLIITILLQITPVYAPSEVVDVSEFPQQLATALNLPLIAGQMLASALILCLFIFPVMLLMNNRDNQSVAVLIVGISVMGFLVAATWLPYWFLLITVLIVAMMYAGKMRDFLGGR